MVLARVQAVALLVLLALWSGRPALAGPSLQAQVAGYAESGGSSLLDDRAGEDRRALQVSPTLRWSGQGTLWSAALRTS